MDEHMEEGEFLGDYSIEAGEEYVASQTETLDGGSVSQVDEVEEGEVKDETCNGNDVMPEGTDGVCDNSGGDGENPKDEVNKCSGDEPGEPGLDADVKSLEGEGDTKEGLSSVGKSEEDGSEIAEVADEKEKPEVEIKNVEACDGAEGAEKAVSAVRTGVADDGAKSEVGIGNCKAGGEENGAEAEGSTGNASDGKTSTVNEESGVGETQVHGVQEVAGSTASDDDKGKESVQKSGDESKESDFGRESPAQEEKGEEVVLLDNETGNPESETIDARLSAIVESLEVKTQLTEEDAAKAIQEEGLNPTDGKNATNSSLTESQPSTVETAGEAATCLEEQVRVSNEGEAMEIDSVDGNLEVPIEEEVEKTETVGASTDDGGNKSADATIVQLQTQEVTVAEATGMDAQQLKHEERSDQETAELVDSSKAKEMEVDKQDTEGQQSNTETSGNNFSEDIVPTDSTNVGHTHEEAFTGKIETETKAEPVGQVSQASDKVKEIATAPSQDVEEPSESIQEPTLEESRESVPDVSVSDSNMVKEMEVDKKFADCDKGTEIGEQPDETHVSEESKGPAMVAEGPKEASDFLNMDNSFSCQGIDQNSGKAQESSDKSAGDDIPDIDPYLGQDMNIGEQDLDAQQFDETGPDGEVNDRKPKADSLNEDSVEESRKTISFAKVSVTAPQTPRPSFRIGECIARAASQMAGSPSILKGTNLGDENLSLENLLSQLHLTARDPSKGYSFLDVVTGFFSEYRNSVIQQQLPADKICGKRSRSSGSNLGSSEAFEFEDMSDTYWTDRVIHNSGEEQAPNEKGNFQIVPVELKPAQIPRGRRPYTKRRFSDHNNNSHLEGVKLAGVDGNSPAELIMNFSEMDTIPSEMNLNKMFRHFGPIRESQTEVDRDSSRARVVFKKSADAEVAFSSAGKFNIFGQKVVNYELSYTITEHFKIQPYVVSLGEEDGMCLPQS